MAKFVVVERKSQSKLETSKTEAGKKGTKAKVFSRRNRSSLHEIIKTKEQAERFMKLLKSV